MYKDFKSFTVHVNKHTLENFALGFDYYIIHMYPTNIRRAKVFQLNFLFFNVTLTRWYTREYISGA